MNIAIIGTGGVARNNYLPYLSKQTDVSLIYYSRTQAKASRCANDFGGQVKDSVERVVADKPDAILVLTPESERYEVTMALLAGRPKRLFFEKPLVAQNGQDSVCEDDFFKARELLQRCKQTGTETAMVFNYRFFDQTLRMKNIIEERHFGRLIHASMFVNYACWSHCIDLLISLGGRASHITALAGTVKYKDAADVSGTFCLDEGATGTILGTNGMNFDSPLYHMIFNFEHGTIRLTDLDGTIEVYDDTARYSEIYGLIGNHSRWDQYKSSFEKSLTAYLESVRKNDAPPIPGVAGLEELQFEAALCRSIERQCPIDVQNEFPIDPN